MAGDKPARTPTEASTWSVDISNLLKVGPIDLDRHSKWPYFMRMQGSVVPRMVVPIFCIGVWTAIITWLAVDKGYKSKSSQPYQRAMY
jgi:putative membrane protein